MFEAVFPFEAPPAEYVLRLCLTALGIEPSATVSLYGEKTDHESMLREVKRRQHFDVEVSGYGLGWGKVKNHRLAFLTVAHARAASEMALLSSLTREVPLITAREYDAEYEYWQNAQDPLEYTAAGRSMEGLSMKSNELPPPLEQMVVDISKNPGRRILRDGYVEAVGHKMWLGPEFFERVPHASSAALRSTSWLRVTERGNDILEIVTQDQPFVDGSTADLQNRLRRLLFPTTS